MNCYGTRSRVFLATLVLAFSSGLCLSETTSAQEKSQPLSMANIHLRGSLQNARIRFEREKKGRVAFMGGSITEMNGYRPMVEKLLQQRFPQTDFTFTDAGIASTCSTTGAFRLAHDVLDKGPVDLFFIEFAVNDDQDAAHARRECIRGMEGIIRHMRRGYPQADIVVTYFVNPSMLETWQAGRTPLSVAAHDEVLKHYQVSTIDLGKEVGRQITAGKLNWRKYGGTHPHPFGNRIAANMISQLLDHAWRQPLAADAEAAPHPLPAPLDPLSYFRGRFVDPRQAKVASGFQWQTPNWKKLQGQCRSRFAAEKLLCAEQAGAELTLAFEGTAIGAYVLAGPDAGMVETSIDGGAYRRVNLYHRFSKGLHYPRTVMFAADLPPGKHTLRLRVAAETPSGGQGRAVRILQFVAN